MTGVQTCALPISRAWDDAALGHATRSLTRNRRTPTLWPSSCLCRGRPLLFLGGRGIGLQAHSLSPSLTRPLSRPLSLAHPLALSLSLTRPFALSHPPFSHSRTLALSRSRALALSRSRVLLLSLALSPSLALSRPPPTGLHSSPPYAQPFGVRGWVVERERNGRGGGIGDRHWLARQSTRPPMPQSAPSLEINSPSANHCPQH